MLVSGLLFSLMKLTKLIKIDDFDNFRDIRDFPPDMISADLVRVVRSLDEREEIEPFIRSILFDSCDTPHGPAEIADILTHKVTVNRTSGIAAFILKGKSFPTVRPQHVSHQIYRLEKIAVLDFAVFATSGIVLDSAKEQFCGTCNRIGCRYAIFDAVDLARLFVAYGFLCPRDARKIVASRCKCGYSPKNRIRNIFQNESLEELDKTYRIGHRAGLIVLPPGSGKTRIAAEGAKSFEAQHILYVAHTHEILDVAQSEFEAVYGSDLVSRHDDSSNFGNPNRVNIATIQLLQKHLSEMNSNVFDYLIIDEFHHAAARSYQQLIKRLEPKFLLGLTATPFRSDRQDIAELCGQNVLVNFELRNGIDSGILSPYHYFGCFDDVDYSNIRHNGFRYDIKDLERSLIIPQRDAAIITKWKELAIDKPTLAFCCSHKHARRVVESFQDNGIPASVYLSDTNKERRHMLIEGFQSGDIKVLCVVDIMNEGVDLPFIECLLFLRPTESQRVFYQQLGRGLRRYTGKSHCVVVDFIGNFKNAYKIVDYQGLLPLAYEESGLSLSRARDNKDIFNLPLGCLVRFDDKVIDVFSQQVLDPKYATRHNISKVLLYNYYNLADQLGRSSTRKDIDRNSLLHSGLYSQVFGTWKDFEKRVTSEAIGRRHRAA